ncbi:MAG: hypothetical protein U0V70_02330 [Terriglobia bacterium]
MTIRCFPRKALATRAEHQRGVALVAVLLALTMLTLIAMGMTFVSSTEVLINDNNAKRLAQLYAADSACEEARLRIRQFLSLGQLSLTDLTHTVYLVSQLSINPVSGDATTNPFFDEHLELTQSNSVVLSDLGALPFSWVKVWPKTETRSAYSLDDLTQTDDPVYFGYSKILPPAKATQFVYSGSRRIDHTGSPVFLLTALAKDHQGFRQSVTIDIARIPCPPLQAAFFANSPIQVLGPTVSVDGNDQGTMTGSSLNGLESQGDITGDPSQIRGSPLALRSFSGYSYDTASLLKAFRPPLSRDIEHLGLSISRDANGQLVATGITLGSPTGNGDLTQVVYAGAPLTLSNSSGQGILIVNGDLNLDGELNYQGLILVNGRVRMTGTGTGIHISGAVLAIAASGTLPSTLDGIVNLLFDSFLIQKQFDTLPYSRIAYKEN